MVRCSLRAGIDVAVYGREWDQIIPRRYIRGTYIANAQLAAYYRRCGILLNDHWESMRSFGFISNRVYDASACGTFVISDRVEGFRTIFPDSHEVADSAEELADKVRYFLAHPEERAIRAERARHRVLAEHTFRHRAETIADIARNLMARSGSPVPSIYTPHRLLSRWRAQRAAAALHPVDRERRE
jgi:spore maturation protein CgeB